MAFQVSPGVAVKEIDLTNVIPAVSTSIGGYAGRFRWGPIEEVSLISSENELANKFGKPNDTYARSFFEGASFLQYGNALKVVRADEDDLTNASSSAVLGEITAITVGTTSGVLDNLSITGVSDTGIDVFPQNFIVTDDDPTGSGAVLSNPKFELDAFSNGADDDGEDQDGSGVEVGDVFKFTLADKEVFVAVATILGGGAASYELAPESENLEFTLAELNTLTDADFGEEADTTGLITTFVRGGLGGNDTAPSINPRILPTLKLKSVTLEDGGSGYQGTPSSVSILADGTDVTSQFNITVSESGSAGLSLIKNDENFENLKSGLTDAVYSRYAGAIGNKTNVYILNNVNFAQDFAGTFEPADNFDSAPDASNELHILVTTTAKEFTGDNAEATELVVETWPFLAVASTAKASDGSNNYYVDVINARSEWIYIPDDITSVATLAATAAKYTLAGGTDGSLIRNAGKVTTALDLLSDAETEDVNLLFTETDSDGVAPTLGNKVLSIATSRKDAVGFVSPAIDDTKGQTASNSLTNVNAYKDLLSAPDSYGVIGSTSLYVYDKYNDKFIHIGSQGHLAGLCANTDDVADTWFSPAGFNRGNLRNVAKVDFNPNKAQRDELYKNGVNPIVAFPGQGIVLFGDKTLQAKPSAFDRVNVRRLFIALEKAIATAAKFQLFELNDEFTRATFRNAVEPFLRDVRGRRGITDFLVVCDETNNTGQVIDTNRFVADIFIKPARSINFITLNFIATRTGVDFSEVVGLTNA